MKGVGIDSEVGPSYACLFVGYTEERMLRRYISMTTLVSVHHPRKLEDFTQYVNGFHISLSYTYELSDTSVSFL